ncbi:Alpha/beta hydrolase [uncultured Gammaproteobacteria bacterium]
MHLELPLASGPVWAATGGRRFNPPSPAHPLPAVLFLHGSGMDHTTWTPQARWFAHHDRTVLAPDLPGHGRSAGPAITSVGGLAEMVICLLDAAGLAQVALVGHSLGALVALEAAAHFPDRVRAIGLIGVGPVMPVNPILLDAALNDLPQAAAMITAWAFGARASFGPAPTPGQALTGIGRRILGSSRPGALHADLTACNTYCDGLSAATRVRCPTVLILGEHDRMSPVKVGRTLAAAIVGSRTVVVPATGHMLPVEAPNAVLDALASFI